MPANPNPKTISFNVGLRGQPHPFTCFDTDINRKITNDIFQGITYPLFKKIPDVTCIVDIGANVGATTVLFANEYTNARIVAFEPAPETFQLLQKNTASISGVEVHPYGLFDTDKEAILYQGNEDTVTRSLAEGIDTKSTGGTIILRDARKCFQTLSIEKIDILKIDTEGAERHILSSIAGMLPQILVIYIEFHSEEDRQFIDALLSPSHRLFNAKINVPHRGDVTYVAKDVLRPWPGVEDYKIVL
ncbi:MAG: FkbM family methyltransferase, partial [Rhodospirillales bacterium]|nr:FkbM family methyltransferase [Rhodospirillales bacterium]